MPTRKATWFPYLLLNLQGEVTSVQVRPYMHESYISREYGHISLSLEPLEVDIHIPPDGEINARVLSMLRADREKLRAKHVALMTKYQYLENMLLGPPAPDVVDGEAKRQSYADIAEDVTPRAATEEEDGIPF